MKHPHSYTFGGDSYIKGFHILLQALRELGKSLEKLKRLNEKYRNLKIQVVGRIGYEKLLIYTDKHGL